MPDGNQAIIPDFSLDSTAQSILTQLVALNKEAAASFKKLVEQAKRDAKDTATDRKENTADREELYKATLAASTAAKGTGPTRSTMPAVGTELIPQLENLSSAISNATSTISQGSQTPAATVPPPATVAGGVSAEDAAKQNKQRQDNADAAAAKSEKAFNLLFTAVSTLSTAVIGTAVLYTGALLDSMIGFGNTLNQLTKSGVAFTDSQANGGMSAGQAMAQLSSMGLDAAGVLGSMSKIVQSMNKDAFVNMTSAFLDATASGADLGMSLDDSVERMGAELQKRQMMGALDGVNQGRLQKQIVSSIKTQQKYASVLGESVDNLVAFTDSLISSTPALTANLMRMTGEMRSTVIAGITDFGSTMRAMGGEEGGRIAEAMTEAAASGAMGFSNNMVGYVTALPSLAGPMNKYIDAINNGTLSQEDAEKMATDVASRIANTSKAERNRIFALARAGDAQAESMAKAIGQFEQSAAKLKSMNKDFTMEGVQKGSNILSAIWKQLTGTVESVKTGFLVGFGSITSTGDDLAATFKAIKIKISAAISEVAKKFGLGGNALGDLTKNGESFGKMLAEKLPGILNWFADNLVDVIKALPAFIDGIKSFVTNMSLAFDVIGGIIDTLAPPVMFVAGLFVSLGKLIGNLFGVKPPDPAMNEVDAAGKPTEAALVAQAAAASASATSLGQLAGGAAVVVLAFKSVSGAMGLFGKKMPSLFDGIGKMFGKSQSESEANTELLGKAQTKSKGFIKQLATGMKDLSKGIGDTLNNLSKGLGSVISNLAKSLGSAGASIGKGIGQLLQGTLTGLGKGLAAIGNPKALMGAAAMLVISSAMFVAAKAFQIFGELSWESIGKGFVALLGVGAVATVLGLALPFIVPGAIAIGALGLALVPFAVAAALAGPAMVELAKGMVIMNDIDALNLALLGPGLASIAVGMAAFSAGGLISGVLDGLGSLFGADSPFDKIAKLGAAAPAIILMSEKLGTFGTVVDSFNEALTRLDGNRISNEFVSMADGIDKLNESMDEISLVKLMKMTATKKFEPVVEPVAEPVVEPAKPVAIPTQGPLTDAQAEALVDQYNSQQESMLFKEPSTSRPDSSTQASMINKPQKRGMAIPANGTVRSSTATAATVRSNAVPTARAQETIAPPAAAMMQEKLQEFKDSQSEKNPEWMKEVFDRMNKNQERTNRLLSKGNSITADLSDDF